MMLSSCPILTPIDINITIEHPVTLSLSLSPLFIPSHASKFLFFFIFLRNWNEIGPPAGQEAGSSGRNQEIDEKIDLYDVAFSDSAAARSEGRTRRRPWNLNSCTELLPT